MKKGAINSDASEKAMVAAIIHLTNAVGQLAEQVGWSAAIQFGEDAARIEKILRENFPDVFGV